MARISLYPRFSALAAYEAYAVGSEKRVVPGSGKPLLMMRKTRSSLGKVTMFGLQKKTTQADYFDSISDSQDFT